MVTGSNLAIMYFDHIKTCDMKPVITSSIGISSLCVGFYIVYFEAS